MAKKFLLGLTVCLCVIFAATVHAACPSGSSQSGDYCYTQFEGEVTITRYQGSGGNVVIPGTIAGMPVVSIGTGAFRGLSSLTGVTIPDSVSSIEDFAFYWCTNLASLTIPDSVISIGRWAFNGAKKVVTLTIPDSVTSIEERAFSGCDNLTSVIIGNSGSGASGVTRIGEGAFYYCRSLNSVIIGNAVGSIEQYAFESCDNLRNVFIGNSVNSIHEQAIYRCATLTSIDVHSDNTYYSSADGILYNEDQSVLIKYPDGKIYTEFTTPESVTSIGNYAFSWCNNLGSITIGNRVVNIGKRAFEYCNNLTSIDIHSDNAYYSSDDGVLYNKDQTLLIQYPSGKGGAEFSIPDGVTTIADWAFYQCNLTSIIIPDSVATIGDWAFFECRQANITIPDSVMSIGADAFAYCDSLTSITIGNNDTGNVTTIGDYAFNNCSALTTVTFGNSVTNIGNWAFTDCSALTSLTLGNKVTSIGEMAFAGCSVLTSVVWGNSVTTIGGGAFMSCDRLTSISLPDSVTMIGDGAFEYCAGLTNVTLGNGVTSIGNGAFYQCNLSSITIPRSVTSIGWDVFYGCSALSVAYFLGNAPTIDSGVFNDTAPDFTICYTDEATGFTSPEWEGYPAADCGCSDNTDCAEGKICIDDVCVAVACATNADCGDGQVCFYGQCKTAAKVPLPVKDTGNQNERACNPASYTDLGNGIVRDNVTGLEWVKDGNLITSRDPSFDNDGTAGDGRVTWQHAIDYVELLNTEVYLGYSDWRLPTIEELPTLVDAGRSRPAIDPAFSAKASPYWTFTARAGIADYAWSVNFYYGGASRSTKSNNYYMRAVRGGPYGSLGNFVSTRNGTITDTATGLMWHQDTAPGIGEGDYPDRYTWQEAMDYVQGLNSSNYCGYGDWRLPTKNELQSLLDYSRSYPATVFPDTVAFYYWSSTLGPDISTHAWCIGFDEGSDYSAFQSVANYVRAVRGGPCWSLGHWCVNDSGCEEGKICDDGVCVDAVECMSDEDCSEGYECVDGECIQIPDDAPALPAGPYLAAGAWPMLPTSQESPVYLDANSDVLWKFSDDFASCSEDCTHAAEYQALGGSEWTTLDVTSNAVKGFAYVTLPIESLQNATTYAFRYSVTDCASQTTQSATYYFRVAITDAPPVITSGPFLAAGAWPVLPTSSSKALVLDQNEYALWTFSDDYAFCSGLCTHRARYRKVGDTAWTWIPVSADSTGKQYAYAELPVEGLDVGTYQFYFDVRDCAGQRTSAPKVYYFKVE